MEELVNKYIKKIERAIDYGLDQERWLNGEISSLRTKLDQQVFNIRGMSTAEVRIFLNELIEEDTRYLEIGIHRGSTFVSALYKNKYQSATAIDHFGGPMYGDDIINEFLRNCKQNSVTNFTLIRNDSFKLKDQQKSDIKDINLYFYDGGHTALEQEMALTYYYSNLANVFIFIVDDWVHQPAKDGTFAAIEKLKLKIHKKWEIGKPQRERNTPGLTWHNGLYIAVCEKI
jgi:hypothetical protein